MEITEYAQLEAQLNAQEAAQRKCLLKHLAQGVIFTAAPWPVIEESVQIGKGAKIGPGVILRGNTVIGENVTIEGYCSINNMQIAAGTLVRAFCYLDDAKVAEDCQIGPFSRMRPGAECADNCHIGNFVELKNSKLASGVKANHLSYLGDADIGSKTNIGAGTITCNYDGSKKFRTAIGENSFVGSNSTLVAPLTINQGAYIGAGSTVTADVPADALALGRSRQRNIEGWAIMKRGK